MRSNSIYLDFLKSQILNLIKHSGPITAAEIAERIPILSDDPIRIIRKKIRELIITDKIPIASSMEPPYGYFLVNGNSEARNHYIAQLKSRINSIAQRLSAFESATARKIQLALFPESRKDKK
uniref:Uncharacterized protein n=1 Tax=candidate division WOR-3 bacterium TaxID=2052148 RepID=A0A7C6A7S2_UNCW3